MSESVPEGNFFGSLDLDGIPETIPTGTYQCEVTEFPLVHNQNKGTDSRILKFEVTDDSDYCGEIIQEWFPVWPKLTQESYEAMDAEDKKKVRDSVKRFKTRMRELGLSDIEIASDDIVEKVIGKKVAVSIRTNGKYTNIRSVVPMDAVDESSGEFSGFNV